VYLLTIVSRKGSIIVIEICPTCRSEYEVYKHKIPMRDKDSLICEICGTKYMSWNGGVMYTDKLLKKGSTDWSEQHV